MASGAAVRMPNKCTARGMTINENPKPDKVWVRAATKTKNANNAVVMQHQA